jgi:uncharacterized Zn-binding protein involved in type VI secretion
MFSMAHGYFIGKGDKTSCGGEVLEGNPGVLLSGRAQAREGDKVTCGQDGQVYLIVGGVAHFNSDGRRAAGTLDSLSGCPCKALLIPQVFSAIYHGQRPAPNNSSTRTEELPPHPGTHDPASRAESFFDTSLRRQTLLDTSPRPNPSARSSASTSLTPALQDKTFEEPGFYIVPASTTLKEVEARLLTAPTPMLLAKFRQMNPHPGVLNAGTMIVLSDPDNQRCSYEESLLLEAAAAVNGLVREMTPEEADFMHRHRDEIQSFLDWGSKGISVSEAISGHHLKSVENLLKELDALHSRSFVAHGHLRSPDFFNERQKLLGQLNMRLGTLTRKSIGLPDHPNLKTALGLSSKSLVHHWNKAGAPGQIPGYATPVEKLQRASKYIKYGGYLGIIVGGGASYMKVKEVCRAGETEACKRIRVTETGAFSGSVLGGMVVATASSSAAAPLCVALGLSTGGLGFLACGLGVAAGGAVGGSLVGGFMAEKAAEVIYERLK